MDWDSAAAVLDGVVAATFDRTSATIIARSSGHAVNGPGGADNTRPTFTRAASIERGPNGFPVAERPAGDPGAQRTAVQFEAVMTADIDDWPWLPRRGDRVEVDGEAWAIAAVQNDGTRRPAFFLNRAG